MLQHLLQRLEAVTVARSAVHIVLAMWHTCCVMMMMIRCWQRSEASLRPVRVIKVCFSLRASADLF